jgi:D-glycero-alpha-D-manno-heptose-7-phosphate kinase
LIITKTPYRLSFFGGGTDYPEWYEKNGGLVIASAFQKYCWISLRLLPPFFEHRSRFVYSNTEEVRSNFDVKHPGIRACLEFLAVTDGLEVHYDGDLPSMSGIGSSSSFTVGLLKALCAFRSKMLSKSELANHAIHVERVMEGQHVGVQDQIMASFGGLQIIRLNKDRSMQIDPLILPKDYEDELSRHVMIGFTGKSRFSTEVASKKVKNMNDGSIRSQLSEIFEIAQRGLSLFERNTDLSEVGNLVHQSWLLKKSLADTISNPSIDHLYDTALRNGAWGGRLLGAGEGGFFMLIAPPEVQQRIRDSLPQIKVWVPYAIDHEGSRVVLFERESS